MNATGEIKERQDHENENRTWNDSRGARRHPRLRRHAVYQMKIKYKVNNGALFAGVEDGNDAMC